MNKLTLLGILVIVCFSSLYAEEEYLPHDYTETVASYAEIISDTSFSDINNSHYFDTEMGVVEENSTVMSSNGSIKKEVSEDFDPYLSALKEAKRTGKIIMLAIRAMDCPYCDKMEKETLSDGSVQSALETDFVTVHYNQDLEPLPLGIQEGMTPNFIFVDKDENIMNMYPGMRTPKEFKEALAEILAQ